MEYTTQDAIDIRIKYGRSNPEREARHRRRCVGSNAGQRPQPFHCGRQTPLEMSHDMACEAVESYGPDVVPQAGPCLNYIAQSCAGE